MDDVTSRKIGAEDADASSVDHRISHRIMDGVEPVIYLLPRIDIAAELTHLCSRCFHHAAVAVAPSAVIEQHDQIAGARKIDGVLPKIRGRSAPAVRDDDRGQLAAFVLGGIKPLGRQAHILADEVSGFEADSLGRTIVARRD